MAYQDKTLTCRDCGREFTFTASEQEFYAQRGFTNEPGRCPECRETRKAERRGSGGYSSGGYSSGGGGGGGYDRPREMFTATCSQCGKEAQVPFQPRDDRPVYCSDCFAQQRGSRSDYGGGGGGGGGYGGGRRGGSSGGGGGGRRGRY